MPLKKGDEATKKQSAAASPAHLKRRRDDATPTSRKRARPAAASNRIVCGECHRRKITCDLVRPFCTQCVRTNADKCEYLKPPVWVSLPGGPEWDLHTRFRELRELWSQLDASILGGHASSPRSSPTPDAGIEHAPSSTASTEGIIAPSALNAGATVVATYVHSGSQRLEAVARSLGCSFAGEPSLPIVSHGKFRSDILATFVQDYIDNCMCLFRFVHPLTLRAESLNHTSQSPLALFAAAIALQRASRASDAELLFRLACQGRRDAEDNDDNFVPDVLHLETVLVECQYLFTARSDVQRLRRVVSHATGIATSLGLHHDPRSKDFAPADIARRRWAFHNVALLDRWTALLTSCPCILKSGECETHLPMDPKSDEAEEAQYKQCAALLQLGQVLGDTLSASACPDTVFQSRLGSQSSRMKEVLSELPAQLQQPEDAPALHLFAAHVSLVVEAVRMPMCHPSTADIAERMILLGQRAISQRSAWDIPWTVQHVFAAGALLTTCLGAMPGTKDPIKAAVETLDALAQQGQLAAGRAHGLLTTLLAAASTDDTRLENLTASEAMRHTAAASSSVHEAGEERWTAAAYAASASTTAVDDSTVSDAVPPCTEGPFLYDGGANPSWEIYDGDDEPWTLYTSSTWMGEPPGTNLPPALLVPEYPEDDSPDTLDTSPFLGSHPLDKDPWDLFNAS